MIRRCVARDQYRVLEHFVKRMDARGMFWADVVAVLDSPQKVRDEGFDRWDRPKWILEGTAPDGLPIAIVCVIHEDYGGELTVFITIYWSEG